MLRAEL